MSRRRPTPGSSAARPRRRGRRRRPLGAATLTAPTTAASTSPPAFHPQLVTVDTPTRGDKERLQTLGLDLTEHAGHDYVEVVLHTAGRPRARSSGDGFTYDVRIPDLVARGVEIAELNEAYAASVARSPLPSGRDTYRTLADYNADMSRAREAAPDPGQAVRSSSGPRLDGRNIYGVEIGQGVRQPNRGEPTFVLMGLHHAREWPSGELAMEFAVDLVKNYGKSDRITRLLRQARVDRRTGRQPRRLRPVPHRRRVRRPARAQRGRPAGGTGSVLATPGHDLQAQELPGRRRPGHPRRQLPRPPSTSNGGFGIGVDLNRNYGGFWGGPGAAATEPDPTTLEAGPLDPTYRGAERVLRAGDARTSRTSSPSRQVTMLISNHTFSNLVLRPNGVNPNTVGADGKPVGDAPDEAALKRLGARMAAQNGYANIHGWQLYDTTGTTEDWSYNATGGFGYTFEIGANEFHPPYPEVVDEYLGAGKYARQGQPRGLPDRPRARRRHPLSAAC